MTTIVQCMLFFLLAHAFGLAAQAARAGLADTRVLGAGYHSDARVQSGGFGQICNYESNGARSQPSRSLKGKFESHDIPKRETRMVKRLRWRGLYLSYWPNRDPIEKRGGVNMYVSLHNDLLGAIDYLGHFRVDFKHGNVNVFEKHGIQGNSDALGLTYREHEVVFTCQQTALGWKLKSASFDLTSTINIIDSFPKQPSSGELDR